MTADDTRAPSELPEGWTREVLFEGLPSERVTISDGFTAVAIGDEGCLSISTSPARRFIVIPAAVLRALLAPSEPAPEPSKEPSQAELDVAYDACTRDYYPGRTCPMFVAQEHLVRERAMRNRAERRARLNANACDSLGATIDALRAELASAREQLAERERKHAITIEAHNATAGRMTRAAAELAEVREELAAAQRDASRRLHDRDAAWQQIDALRHALGGKVGEGLGTEDIVALLTAAKVTGSMVEALAESERRCARFRKALVYIAAWCGAPGTKNCQAVAAEALDEPAKDPYRG